MKTILSIALLLIGSVATLSAFGGKTCRDGEETLLGRITRRGWVSLSCLLLALIVGVISQIVAHKAEINSAAAAVTVATEANRREQFLSGELLNSRHQLELANQNIESLSKLGRVTQNRVDEQKITLKDLRVSLSSTRTDLSQQSKTALITALSNSGATIADISISVPFTNHVPKSKDIWKVLFPRFRVAACADITDLSFELPGTNQNLSLQVNRGDEVNPHLYFNQKIPEAFSIVEYERDPILDREAGQTSFNGYAMLLQAHPVSEPLLTARYYAQLTQPGFVVFSVTASWPATFGTFAELSAATKKWPLFLPRLASYYGNPFGSPEEGKYPEACSKELEQYFTNAFDKGAVAVKLGGDNEQYLYFYLKAKSPVRVEKSPFKKSGWRVDFVINSVSLSTATSDPLKLDGVTWPEAPTAQPIPRSISP